MNMESTNKSTSIDCAQPMATSSDRDHRRLRPTGRAILWFIPRSTSTVFTMCMSGIPECEAWFEPYGHCGLAARRLEEGGMEGDIASMSYEGNEEAFDKVAAKMTRVLGAEFEGNRLQYSTIKRQLEESPSRYVFVKDESSGMDTASKRNQLPSGFMHAFLIRHPYLVFQSTRRAVYRQMKKENLLLHSEDEASFDFRNYLEHYDPTRRFRQHYEFWRYVRENIDPSPIVIDAGDLLAKPAEVLPKFCEAMGLPYSDSLLRWKGTMEILEAWKWPAEGFHIGVLPFLESVISSTCFTPPKAPPARDQLTPDILGMVDDALPYYEEMHRHRIHVSD